jgi:hypothetical protein
MAPKSTRPRSATCREEMSEGFVLNGRRVNNGRRFQPVPLGCFPGRRWTRPLEKRIRVPFDTSRPPRRIRLGERLPQTVMEIALALPPSRAIHRVMLPAVLVAVALVGEGCYPKVAPPPAALSANSVALASTRWPGVTAGSLSTGHDLFMAHCDVCHGYPDLNAIPDERWPGILEKMAKKSHLGAEERDAILHFVLASRSEQGAR